ncbi:DsbA family oxidoreductase [Geomonas ferrireducens]|uniref:DsbA family oxidoreductase n=1 Tax=Geomonas ferrireducens TaxID=2570227 RepID=UPI0010A7ADA8|nr:DsbA family protein [Geomonas ferrireducens]
MNKIIEIVEFTDPVCTWCWGSEPVLRKLETRFGEQVKVSFIMAGLVKDITAFYDSYNDIGGDPVRSNRQIAKHWLEASQRHGMPVKIDGFSLFSRERVSSYPLNVAYKSAQMQDQNLADRFLRRVREASAAEAKLTNTTEVLVELASEVGLDVARFVEDFSNGAAQKAFEQDLAITQRYNARGFPTFLVRFEGKETLLRGYRRYEDFKAVIGLMTEGEIAELPISPSEEAVMAFIRTYLSVAPVEIKMTFDLADAEWDSMLDSLLAKGMIVRREAGNGYFVSPKTGGAVCDTVAGTCTAV